MSLADLISGPAGRVLVMGIVNVTPDSFSDGGVGAGPDAAVDRALHLIADGADLIDIGGESTRPGAAPVPTQQELDRILPVIEGLAARTGVPISVDTLKPEVARLAMGSGARIWNDVTALGDPAAMPLAAALGCDVILMHMQGEPRSMQLAPHYQDVVAEVEAFLLSRARAAEAGGVHRDHIWLDPGIGFGKTVAHNLALLAALPRLAGHGYPVVLGASRKRFIASLDGQDPGPTHRLGGSIAAALQGARSGCRMVRVHDVAQTVQALKVWSAIAQADATA